LARINFIIISVEKVFTHPGHFAVDPLSFVPLIRLYELLNTNSVLLVILKLPFVDVTRIIFDLAHAFKCSLIPCTFKHISAAVKELADSMFKAFGIELSFIYTTVVIMKYFVIA
jgi:hypothetical protein